jgi:hypothetical protein
MRSVLSWAFLSLLSTGAFAVPHTQDNTVEVVPQNVDATADSAAAPAGGDEGVEYTVFNDIKVPPMKDIEGEQFNETIRDGYW